MTHASRPHHRRTRLATQPRILFALLCAIATLASHAGHAQATNGDTPPGHLRVDDWSLDARSLRDAYRRWRIQRTAAERLATYPESANTVAWLIQAYRLDDALTVLARIVERQPAGIADAWEPLGPMMLDIELDQSRGYRARIDGLVSASQQARSRLDGEAAARLDIALLSVERRTASREEADARRRAVLEAHAGTTAARLAAIDFDGALDLGALAAQNPGSIVAAKARYRQALRLAASSGTSGQTSAGSDPTERFLEALAIVKELESGGYPPSKWIDDAPGLIPQLWAYRPQISSANATRLLEALRQVIREHQSMLNAPDGDGLTYVVEKKLPAIAAFLPDGAAAMERLFAAFAGEWRDKAAAPYFKARWLDLEQEDGIEPLALAPRSATHEADVRALLASAAAAEQDSVFARRALARLAEREFEDPASLASAHAHFSEYLRRFRSASDAWVVSLRLGQVEQAQRRLAEASRRFADTARAHPAEPIARALGFAYAARASEEVSDFTEAFAHYRDAAAAWTADVGDMLQLDLPRPRPSGALDDLQRRTNPTMVSRDEVQQRVGELARSLPVEGGRDLERGRWLLRQGRSREAVEVLQQVATSYARTTAGNDARAILTRARLDAAVALAETANPSANPAEALKELDALGGEAFNPSSGIAGILGATLRMLQRNDSEADGGIRAALQRWVKEGSVRPSPAPGSLEHDVLAIRDTVFKPLGDPRLRGRWNGFGFPATLPPFLVAPAALRVRTTGSNVWTTVDVSRQPAGLTNVVFMAAEDVEYLTAAVSRLGGTRRRQPGAIMEVPNQPIGEAQTIIRWWDGYFPARPGHWSGFEIETYPAFRLVEFTNAERTRALVPVTIGYAGATVVLEKVNGTWTIKELTNEWVT